MWRVSRGWSLGWVSCLFFFSGNRGDIQQRFPGSSSPATKTSTTSTTVDGAPIFGVQLCSCSHNVKGSTGSTHPFCLFSQSKRPVFWGAKRFPADFQELLSTRTILPFVTSIRMSLKLPWPIFVGLKHDSFDGPVPYLYQNMMVKFGKYLHKYTLFELVLYQCI